MKGVPIRIEVGMRDINDDAIIYSRRDKQGKHNIDIGSIKGYFPNLLDDIQQSLFDQAKEFQESNTHSTNSYDDFKNIIKKGGFVKCGWDGTNETEEKIKKDTKATIRCIPFNQDTESLKCIYSDTQAKYQVIFARAY